MATLNEVDWNRPGWGGPEGEPIEERLWTDPFEPRPGLVFGVVPRSVILWTVSLYIFVIVLRPWEELFPWLQAIRFERVFTLGVLAVVALTRGYRLRPDWQTLSVVGMVAVMWVTAVTAQHPELAYMGPSSAYEYTTTALIFFVLISAVRGPYELAWVIVCYVVANALYVSKSQWEFWLHGAGYSAMGVVRLQGIDGTNGHPNSFATMILVHSPFILVLLRHVRTICASWPSSWRKLFRWGLYFAVGLVVVSTLMTNSRAGFLTLLIMSTLAVGLRGSLGRVIKLGAALLVIAAVAWAMLPEATRGRFLSIVDRSASTESAAISAEGRLVGFQMGIETFRRFPVTGVGPGNFVAYRIAYLDGVELDPHNLVAELLAACGILGGVAFPLFLLGIWKNSTRLVRRGKKSGIPALKFYRDVGVAIRFSLLALMLMGLFTHNLFRIEWMWLAAVGVIAVGFARRRENLIADLTAYP